MRKRQLVRILITSFLVCLFALGCRASQETIAPNQPPNSTSTQSAAPALTHEQGQAEAIDSMARELPFCSDRSEAYKRLRLQEIDPVFRLCAAELLERTRVPIVLPPNVSQVISDQPLYSRLNLPATNADMYWIELVLSPREVPQAAVAIFNGVGSASPFVVQDLRTGNEMYRNSLQEGLRRLNASPQANTKTRLRAALQAAIDATGPVRLAQGITGYYAAAVCPVEVPTSACEVITDGIAWEDQGFQYGMQIKLGVGKLKILELANAAIENQG